MICKIKTDAKLLHNIGVYIIGEHGCIKASDIDDLIRASAIVELGEAMISKALQKIFANTKPMVFKMNASQGLLFYSLLQSFNLDTTFVSGEITRIASELEQQLFVKGPYVLQNYRRWEVQ